MHGILHSPQIVAKMKKRVFKLSQKGNPIAEDNSESYWPAPLIMTINNYFAKNIQELKKASTRDMIRAETKKEKDDNKIIKTVFLQPIPVFLIKKKLLEICEKEHIKSVGLDEIAKCSFGDMRRAITLLQEACRVLNPSPNSLYRGIMSMNEVNTSCSFSQAQKNDIWTLRPETTVESQEDVEFLKNMGWTYTYDTNNIPHDDSETFIPDKSAHDIVNIVLRDSISTEYLENLLKKHDDAFLHTVMHVHLPKYMSQTYRTYRHPYLPPSNDSQMNVLDGLVEMCDSWSIADVYSREGAWKKNELYEYFQHHNLIRPAIFARYPDSVGVKNYITVINACFFLTKTM